MTAETFKGGPTGGQLETKGLKKVIKWITLSGCMFGLLLLFIVVVFANCAHIDDGREKKVSGGNYKSSTSFSSGLIATSTNFIERDVAMGTRLHIQPKDRNVAWEVRINHGEIVPRPPRNSPLHADWKCTNVVEHVSWRISPGQNVNECQFEYSVTPY